METTKNAVQVVAARQRRALVDRANEHLREIEIYFNTVSHWNTAVRKPGEEEIVGDPDGKMAAMAKGLSDLLQRESKHKMPRAEWLLEIRSVAILKYEFTAAGAAKTDWQQYAHDYYLDCTPEEALVEDLQNA